MDRKFYYSIQFQFHFHKDDGDGEKGSTGDKFEAQCERDDCFQGNDNIEFIYIGTSEGI